MIKKLITLTLIIISTFFLLQPVYAQRGIDPSLKPEYAPGFPQTGEQDCPTKKDKDGNIIQQYDENLGVCIQKGYEAEPINAFLQVLAGALLMLSGAVAVVVFAVAGVMYITARGNQQQMEYAKNTLVYGVIGIVVIVFSYFIVRFVLQLVTGNV